VAATVKWALRVGLHRLAPSSARRLFTVHYACLCVLDEQPRRTAASAPCT
jgi:hypothetical protein